jgi:uncharacterized protein YuzB (UPF0349 family)
VKGLSRYIFPCSPDNARRHEEIDALISEVINLLKEMTKVEEKLWWFEGCPLETALEINELIKRAEDFCEACYQYHYSLVEGKSVSDTDIAGLREGYERLKEAWLEFLAKNRLGIIYL